MPTREERFWTKVAKSDDPAACWLWTGFKLPSGYGMCGHHKYAHRYSWELANGRPVPEGLDVMHSCDNPSCVRPEHLSAGTRTDNMQDASSKGRIGWKSQPGEANGHAKLTEAIVRELRSRVATGEPLAAVCRELNVKFFTARDAVRGRTWRHVL